MHTSDPPGGGKPLGLKEAGDTQAVLMEALRAAPALAD